MVEKQSRPSRLAARATRARRTKNVGPATMADPTNGKEACLGTLCEA